MPRPLVLFSLAAIGLSVAAFPLNRSGGCSTCGVWSSMCAVVGMNDDDSSQEKNKDGGKDAGKDGGKDGGKDAGKDAGKDGTKDGPGDAGKGKSRDAEPQKGKGRDAGRGAKAAAKGDGVDPAWLDRMPPEDRQALAANVGFVPPAFTSDLTWLGGDGMSTASGDSPVRWEDLRGKVVVLQSWTSKSSGGRTTPQRTQELLKDFKPEDVTAIYLHTPEGADKAEEFVKQAETSGLIAVDGSGAFCDALGVFKRPVNLVVGRDGNVAYVGLSPTGLRAAVDELAKKPFDPNDAANERPTAKEPTETAVKWPTFSEPVGKARDLRGKPSPAFHVPEWISDPVNPNGRLVLIDFFATWCGPCMAAVPHMNELADRYEQEVCVVGLSDESKRNFNDGLMKRNKKPRDFRYGLGVDPSGRMKGAFGVAAIPHCAIISTDGIVRWQGHPMGLTPSLMDSLVSAHKAAGGGKGAVAAGGPPKRWESEKRKQK